jgi:hypothetical protein
MFIFAAFLITISVQHYNDTRPYEFVSEPYVCYDRCA